MALVSRWDIRYENYSDGATVTSLTDRVGTTNLDSAMGTVKPIYDSALNAVKFIEASTHCLGSTSLSAALSSTPSGSAWSIFFLIYQTTLAGQFVGGFGNSAQVNSGLLARTFATGTNPQFFLRDNTDSTSQTVSATAQLTAATWQVLHITYDGTNVRVGIDGASLSSSTALTEVLSGVSWNRFALGAYVRSSTGSHWTGFLRECRVYNSNEFSNLSTIISDMKAGPSIITSVGTNNTIYANNSNIVVTGSALTSGISAKLVYNNQEILMLDYVANETQPYFNSPSLANVFASRIQFTDSANLQILNAQSGIIATKIVSFQPSPTKLVHNVIDVSQAGNIGSIYYNQLPVITSSDQIIYDAKSSLNYDVSIDNQGYITIYSLNTDANDSFTFRIYESTMQVWGTEGTKTFIGSSAINAISRAFRVVKSSDGKRYSKFPTGDFGATYSSGVLTIKGTFPTKSTATPYFFRNFNSETTGATATSIGFSDLGGDSRGTCVVSTVRSYSGSKSLRMDYPTGYNSVFPKLGITGLNATEVYISCQIYYERYVTGVDPGTSLILKLCRAGANPVYTGIPRMFETIRPNFTSGIVAASDKGFVTSSGSTNFNTPFGNANRDQWNRLEYRYKLSTPGISDGIFQTWTNLSYVNGSAAAQTRAAGDTGVIQEIMSPFDGMDTKGTDNAYYMYLDDFYVDTTCVRVEVGDASTLGSCTKRITAVPSSWTNSIIIADLDISPLGSGTRWVYIFDSNNQQYGNALEVTL